MATVETKALRKEFTGHTAVDGVDLAIREGEFLVLLRRDAGRPRCSG